ncbi:hypothetical protein QA861_30765 [Streptomyces sp. B21-083]
MIEAPPVEDGGGPGPPGTAEPAEQFLGAVAEQQRGEQQPQQEQPEIHGCGSSVVRGWSTKSNSARRYGSSMVAPSGEAPSPRRPRIGAPLVAIGLLRLQAP